MDWGPPLAAVTGATIALSGALLGEIRRDKGLREREREFERWRICVDFALALDAAHGSLRDVARVPGPPSSHRRAADESVGESGVYAARERLLMSAGLELAGVAEHTFLKLIEVRDVVRTGASMQSADYHRAYHAFTDALWRFRSAVRTQFGNHALTPRALDRASWSDRENCVECRGQPPGPVATSPADESRRHP